ncbi:MAG: hypothetical protein K9G64_00415 [Bacteroidia bacterium]|nr:hypothetical protein [Bacteroidia bacterium]
MKLIISLILSICLLTTSLFAQNNTTKEIAEPSFELYKYTPMGFLLSKADRVFTRTFTGNDIGEPGFALYINSPIGLLSKMRIKAEMRFDNNLSIMGSFSSYHNMWAGNQSYLEMRRYKTKRFAKHTYHFARIGSGQTIGGNYFLAAFGWGTQRYFGKDKRFFIDYSRGFKVCPKIYGEDLEKGIGNGFKGLFYILGPGAIYDLNLNIGYRF